VESHYPCLIREVIDSERVKYCLVDIKFGEVLAYWIEYDENQSEHSISVNSIDEYLPPHPTNSSSAFDPLSVYVGNLHPGISREELASHFYAFGEILCVTMLRSKKKGVNAAFIRFASAEDAHKALFLNSSFMRGNAITVLKKLRGSEEIDVEDPDDLNVDPLSIYIGNLDERITSLDLIADLTQYGEVEKVTILRDRESGIPKGSAYVLFKDEISVSRALALNGSILYGKKIRIKRKRKTISSDDGNNNVKVRKKEETLISAGGDEDSFEYDPCSIYVGNMSQETTEEDLRRVFNIAGGITRLSILKSGKSAYIEFDRSTCVERALSMNGCWYKGGVLKVERKKQKIESRNEVKGADNNNDISRDKDVVDDPSILYDPCSIYVGNISAGSHQEDLKEIFKPAGYITGVFIHKSGKSAYIHFEDPSCVEKALSMNGSHLNGVALRVERKKKKED